MARNNRPPQIMDSVAFHTLYDTSVIANEIDEAYIYKLLTDYL